MHVWEVVGSLVLCAGLVGCAGGKHSQRSDSQIVATQSEAQPASAPQSPTVAGGSAAAHDPWGQITIAGVPNLPQPLHAAWMTYVLGVTSHRLKALKEGRPIDRLAEEALGIKTVVATWAEMDKQGITDEYLSALTKVVEAGFAEEYALRFYARPGWSVRPEKLETLKLTAFSRWAQKHLPKHRIQRGTEVRWKSDGPPLGAEFSERLPEFHPSQCASISAQLRGLATEWESHRVSLPERLYSSVDSAQFYRSIERLQASARLGPVKPAEMIWISPIVGNLYNAAAFCAIEAKQVRDAEAYLRKALLINPAHANGYGELAFVLISQRRFADALAELEQGMLVTEDPCLQAMMWRKRGYIFIELDQLVAARGAYLVSLEMAPGNKLALSELQLIEQAMRDRGMPVEPLPPGVVTAQVPNLSGVILSICE